MARSAKTVSIRHLHTAVKHALEEAKKQNPEVTIPKALGDSGETFVLPIYFRYPYICGIPPFPWLGNDFGKLEPFTNTFVNSLASDRQISAAGVDGKFQPTILSSEGNVAIGFAPGDVSFTE
jgi:hypothetical protein